ncbi:MAG: DUF1415 family protein [Kofleriaceae bacterium]
MDADAGARACEWARRYVDVVARFDLCPWAAPALAKGEVWITACDQADLEDALARFAATPAAVVGLVVVPGFTGTLAALRRLRGELCERPIGRTVALAEFHPDAPLDDASAQRLIPYLRRSPDPMLQAVRHETLAHLRRGGTTMAAELQAAVLAGHPVPPVRDIGDQIADANLATLRRDGAALAAALDALISQRRASPP